MITLHFSQIIKINPIHIIQNIHIPCATTIELQNKNQYSHTIHTSPYRKNWATRRDRQNRYRISRIRLLMRRQVGWRALAALLRTRFLNTQSRGDHSCEIHFVSGFRPSSRGSDPVFPTLILEATPS